MIKPSTPKNSNNKLQENRKEAVPPLKPETRDNVFSKSRDIHEDRGMRQIKTEHSSQTNPHAE
jgi:hypothetical protein